ncbi:nose resistant to fluoxetine protein 6 isoform X4 [Bactrocera oleae]|uniref:nose resistant to fluoxetine protein 6 isoform X4 n=1 Tax=Bactrocera oleae TaxID=104688 RepID=UPI00387E9E5B
MRTIAAVIVAAYLAFVVVKASVASRAESVSSAETSLARPNFLVGVAQLGALHENGTRCGRELETLLKAVAAKEFWSIKVLDSFGAPPPSFSWGNNHWFGPQWKCNDLNEPYVVATSSEFLRTYAFNPFNVTSPFRMRFTMVYMRFSTPHFIDLRLPYESFIHIGLCLPQSCSSAALRRYTDEFFRRGEFTMQRDFELQMQSVAARVPSFGLDFFQQTGTLFSIALLLVYNFLSSESRLKEIRQNDFVQNSKLFGKLLLQRYLRLTPMLITTMLLSDVFYDLTNTYSPFYLGVNSGYYCKQYYKLRGKLDIPWSGYTNFYIIIFLMPDFSYFIRSWWHNVLYIQNFLDMKDICCSWTWYLACEMQFYLLITVLLFLYVRRERFAKFVFVTLALGFPVVGWLCYYYNGITFDIDKVHSTLNQLYVKPWVRINPYFGGALCGWLLHNHDQQRRHRYHNHQQQNQQQHPPNSQSQSEPHVPTQQQQQQQAPNRQPSASSAATATAESLERNNISWWRAAFWLFAGIVCAVANFMGYWHSTPTWLVATIMSFGKLLFALCIGGGILMCAWGHGGRLNVLLSARLFRLLNKFCFSIYLLTPIITLGSYGLRNEPTSFNEIASGSDFIAVNVLAVLSSFLAYVLMELPMQRVCNKLLHKRK